MSVIQKEAIVVYASGVSNLVIISTAGLAAATALMQISGGISSSRYWYLAALIAFFVGLILCFFSLSGLTGQATVSTPNIHVSNIKFPTLFAFFMVCIGFGLLGWGAFSAPPKLHSTDFQKALIKLEGCRTNHLPADQRLDCYDAFFDSQLLRVDLTNEQLNQLSGQDRSWIKLLIQRIKNQEE